MGKVSNIKTLTSNINGDIKVNCTMGKTCNSGCNLVTELENSANMPLISV